MITYFATLANAWQPSLASVSEPRNYNGFAVLDELEAIHGLIRQDIDGLQRHQRSRLIASEAIVLAIHFSTALGHALAWPTIYATALCVVLLVLLAEATNVALFASDKRAERALKILRELVRLIRRWPR